MFLRKWLKAAACPMPENIRASSGAIYEFLHALPPSDGPAGDSAVRKG